MNKRQLDDWLERYLELTQSLESPLQYNIWCGISAIASCLQRKCYCNWGFLKGYEYPSFYIALVGPPGGRKGTAMRPAKTMLEEIEVLIGSNSLGSSQALYKEISDSQQTYPEHDGKEKAHKSLNYWADEFVVFLSDKDPNFIRSLCDLYDAPNNWKYSSIGRGVDNVSNCWLNIVGGITPSLLQTALSAESIGGGLVSRIIFVVGHGASKRVALPFLSPEEEELKIKLVEDLAQIQLLSGPFILTKAFLKVWQNWYEGIGKTQGVEDEKFEGYNARRAKHVSKLCMIMSASENNSMEILPKHFYKSLAILEHNETEMSNAFKGASHGFVGDIQAEILSFIEKRRSFNFNEISAALQLILLPKQIPDYLESFKRSGQIVESTSPTGVTRFDVTQIKEVKKENKLLNETLFRRLT